MLRWILIGVLSLGLIGSAVWGYQENQEKNALLIQAENSYQKSFHELTYYLDMLHDEIGTVLAMNSKERISPKFIDIWRLTSEAQTNVGQLPVGLIPFTKTEEFLSEIGEFTYRTSVRNLDDEPLTNKEYQVLENLYTQANDIKNELRHVQHIALENNLRWMDVQLALVNNEHDDNAIINGFKTVESSVEGYQETNQLSGLVGVQLLENKFEHLEGKEISEQQARARGKKIFDLESGDNLKITESKEGADIPIYSLSYQNDEKQAYMDVTKKGGYPITLLVDRPLKEKKLSLNEGEKKAAAFLKTLDFENMLLYQSAEYNKTGMYSYLYQQDDIRIYSDAIEVKIALDDGDILGLTARNYIHNHHEREIAAPKITEEEARAYVNPNVQIQEAFLAIITNELNEEVLTHEFLGTLGDETYRIFINAENGMEEMVEKLGGKELNYSF